jgi:hypothetical protein
LSHAKTDNRSQSDQPGGVQRRSMRAETIDDVKGEADGIIDWGHDRRTRLGYFPALYRKVTVEVKKGIEDGFFEDGKRMERLDRIAGKTENAIINLSMGNAREFAWRTALELAPLSEAERASRVERLGTGT